MADYLHPDNTDQPPTESAVDTAYDEYIGNLEKSTSDLSDDNVMKDVLDSFLASRGEDPQSLSLPTPEKRLGLYKTLDLKPPPPSEGTLTLGSLSWYKDSNLLAPPMTYEEFLKRRYGLDLVDLFAGPPEPRPPDQPNLPEVISGSSEETDGRPKSKGRMVRGIGSLMRSRVFPLIQAAQMGYDLLPEDKKFAGDFIDYLKKTKTHELFGMDKSGLDYLRGLFGMEQSEPEGGIITLPEKMYQDFYHGTPNRWSSEEGYPVGRPRLDFMGTGEGAQVYAPGFYGGEARAVGYEYADMLAQEHGTVPNVYKGEIREDIINDKFIDFNLPVNEQSLDVQEVFEKLGFGTETPDRFAGADILLRMTRSMGEDAAIDALREEGIVGLRYLDKFSRDNKNLYKGKSLVKEDGRALFLNDAWQRQGRDVLQYLVDNDMDMGEFVSQQREVYSKKGRVSRALGGARRQEKLLDVLEGTVVKKSPLTRNMVVWDQPLLDQIGRTIKKEMSAGGFVDKPLYDDARVGGLI